MFDSHDVLFARTESRFARSMKSFRPSLFVLDLRIKTLSPGETTACPSYSGRNDSRSERLIDYTKDGVVVCINFIFYLNRERKGLATVGRCDTAEICSYLTQGPKYVGEAEYFIQWQSYSPAGL